MKLRFDDSIEAFRAELLEWLADNRPTPEEMAADPSVSTGHAPAWARAVACPARTSMPRLPMVAVLDTNPEATAESATAWRACMRRRARCASDWITSSTMTSRTTTFGFSTPCHSGASGASGYTSKASAANTSPLRTSPGWSH